MRTLLFTVLLALALAACGKKTAPGYPGGGNTSGSNGDAEEKEQDVRTPDDPDQMPADSADPCEGGE